jgi:hypothetical protein
MPGGTIKQHPLATSYPEGLGQRSHKFGAGHELALEGAGTMLPGATVRGLKRFLEQMEFNRVLIHESNRFKEICSFVGVP